MQLSFPIANHVAYGKPAALAPCKQGHAIHCRHRLLGNKSSLGLHHAEYLAVR